MLPTPKNGIFACVCVLLFVVSPFYYFDFCFCCLAVNWLYNYCSRRKSCSVAPPLDPPRKSKGIASGKVRLWYTTLKNKINSKLKKQWRKDFFSDVGKIPSPSTSVSAVIVKIVLNSGVYKKRKHSCVCYLWDAFLVAYHRPPHHRPPPLSSFITRYGSTGWSGRWPNRTRRRWTAPAATVRRGTSPRRPCSTWARCRAGWCCGWPSRWPCGFSAVGPLLCFVGEVIRGVCVQICLQ